MSTISLESDCMLCREYKCYCPIRRCVHIFIIRNYRRTVSHHFSGKCFIRDFRKRDYGSCHGTFYKFMTITFITFIPVLFHILFQIRFDNRHLRTIDDLNTFSFFDDTGCPGRF